MDKFTFNISLSVLDHLGRNLYRSFATVLGEAISNAWDADADNVWIYIDKENDSFIIKDDGVGMNAYDFQEKFLKIGYSKRKEGRSNSVKGRPYIGRKGIGKLALLSCSDNITIISKIKDGDYVGGVIDNSGLDRAITDDLKPQDYTLGRWMPATFKGLLEDHEQGTIIYFENIKEGIKNSLKFLKKIIALNFRFSLLDDSFNIFVDNEKITLEHLDDLAKKTEFLWNINGLYDPYIKERLVNLKEDEKPIGMDDGVSGFIASVGKPRDLKITTTDERVGVDLFVNGRLRERDILKHIPTARVAESYLYGQIHYNNLDDDKDRFTSSREGIVADDPKYLAFLEKLRKIIFKIVDDWDKWRISNREDGDSENLRISKKERKSRELFNAVTDEYILPEDFNNKVKVDGWVGDLSNDATFNFGSYAECFVSENLIRKYIQEKNIDLSPEAQRQASEMRRREERSKAAGNINIDLRQENSELSYLDMADLTNLVDKAGAINRLPKDAKEYKPIRDALMHTAMLTVEAKRKLTAVYDNMKARIKTLLSD